jgi:hypothetical protein
VIWNLRSAALRPDGFTSADAAGLPIFAGLVRYDEVQAGAIRHAIRVTVSSTQNAWVHPASHCAGDSASASAPPMGLRLRLGAAYDISGLTGAARVIAVALKRYGFIVADNGSNWYFSGTSDRRWDDENLNQLKSIPGSALRGGPEPGPDPPLLSSHSRSDLRRLGHGPPFILTRDGAALRMDGRAPRRSVRADRPTLRSRGP